MNKLFRPAIALMNRLNYPKKFALISLLFAIPIALLSTFYLAEINSKIAFGQKEIEGNLYLRPLRQLSEHTLQHALLAHDYANGDSSLQARLRTSAAEIDADLQAVRALDARLGERLGTSERLAELEHDWQALKARTDTIRSRPSDDLHEQMIGHIRALNSLVGDNSNLILDPDLDSYYIMDSTLLKLPETQSQIARLRLIASRVLEQRSANAEDRAELITLVGLVQANLDATQRGLAIAFHNTAHDDLSAGLSAPLDAYLGAVNTLLSITRQDLIAPRTITLTPAAYRTVATNALGGSFAFWDDSVGQLDQLLQARIDAFSRRKYLVIGITAAILVLVLFVWLAFYQAVMRTVRALASASERMIGGDMSRLVRIENRDELGQVVRSFNSVAAALVAANAQQQAVLDNAVDGIMTLEIDGRIASFNPAAERIFGLGAAELIGQPITRIIPAPHDEEYRKVGVGREVIGRRADGTSFPLDLAVGEMRMDDGHRYIAIAHDLTERKRAAEERARMQEQIIQAQAAALAELSTPLIPISDDVVAMPLIGALDQQRLEQVLAALLSGVERRRARVAILDITGVPLVDTQVANGLIVAAQAVRLLGARVILTGIRPEVAQTLVGLGVNLNDLATHSTLQSGIAYAMNGQRKANPRSR